MAPPASISVSCCRKADHDLAVRMRDTGRSEGFDHESTRPDAAFAHASGRRIGWRRCALIDADPVATAVRVMMAARTVWTGNASDPLGALGEVVGERAAKSKTWRITLGHCLAGCAGLRRSCAK